MFGNLYWLVRDLICCGYRCCVVDFVLTAMTSGLLVARLANVGSLKAISGFGKLLMGKLAVLNAPVCIAVKAEKSAFSKTYSKKSLKPEKCLCRHFSGS